MLTTKKESFLSGALENVVCTRVDAETSISRREGVIAQDQPTYADPASVIRGEERLLASREAWQRVIDHKLIEWGSAPSQLEDEGIDPPTKNTIQRAIRLAQAYQEEGRPAPDRVVPDPNGGIVFERQEQDVSEVLYIWEDGTTEYQRFQDARLVERRTL